MTVVTIKSAAFRNVTPCRHGCRVNSNSCVLVGTVVKSIPTFRIKLLSP